MAIFEAKSIILVILVLILVSNIQTDTKYDMKCQCGVRKIDKNSEKDCEESARLEYQDQEINIFLFRLYICTTFDSI